MVDLIFFKNLHLETHLIWLRLKTFFSILFLINSIPRCKSTSYTREDDPENHLHAPFYNKTSRAVTAVTARGDDLDQTLIRISCQLADDRRKKSNFTPAQSSLHKTRGSAVGRQNKLRSGGTLVKLPKGPQIQFRLSTVHPLSISFFTVGISLSPNTV